MFTQPQCDLFVKLVKLVPIMELINFGLHSLPLAGPSWWYSSVYKYTLVLLALSTAFNMKTH